MNNITKIKPRLDEALDKIRKHPFIIKSNNRILTNDQIERWVMCAGHESYNFPVIIEGNIKTTTNKKIRQVLKNNLNDENGNGNGENSQSHFKHYLNLLDDLGIDVDRLFRYQKKPGIKVALSIAYHVASMKNDNVSLGYLLFSEGSTPLIYGAVKQSVLDNHPNVETNFFDLHIESDEEHCCEIMNLSVVYADSMEEFEYGVSLGQRGMELLLDEALGIFESYGDVSTNIQGIKGAFSTNL